MQVVSYDSILLVKQVPDTANVTADAMRADGTVNRGALPAIFNPEDLHALETALEVKDRYGGTVTALTMGPPKAAEVLRALADRGHRLVKVSGGFGGYQGIWWDRENDVLIGGSESRKDGCAMGY